MVILNTTFCIDDSEAPEVLEWIGRAYAPSAAKAGAQSSLLLRVVGIAEPGSTSYALHLAFPDLQQAERWNDGVAASLRRIMHQRWGERALAFTTYLEEVK